MKMRSYSSATVGVLLGVVAPHVVRAQVATFDHSAAIDGVLRDLGGAQGIARGRPDALQLLAVHSAERGQFLHDLYDLQRLLLRDYALYRDSLGRAGGRKIPESQYFLARALHELGMKEQATTAYASLNAAASPAIRALAAEWSATLRGGETSTWIGDLTKWRAGQRVAAPKCPPANSTCQLFAAIVANDLATMVRLQREMLAVLKPDFEVTIRSSAEPYEIEFYDPLPLLLLSAADYAIAAQAAAAIKGIPDAEALTGIALYRTERRSEAEAVLRRVRGAVTGGEFVALGSAVLGELLAARGSVPEAERIWRQAADDMGKSMVLDARARAGVDAIAARRQAVLAQFASARSKGWPGMKDGTAGGEHLARALLKSDQPLESITVLEEVRPPSYGENLNRVKPAVLVLLTRARYGAGRSEQRPELYSLARGPIAAIATSFPVVTPALKLLQLVTAPANYGAVRSGNE